MRLRLGTENVERPLPPLRERLGDVPLLADRFLQGIRRRKRKAAADGNRVRAAKALGISRRTLHRKIAEYGLSVPARRGRPPAEKTTSG